MRAAVVRRCRVRAAAAAVTAGAVGLVGGIPAAAGSRTVVVHCNENPGALQPAINAAPSGSTLLVEGKCVGNFTISNTSLALVGGRHAVLDAGGLGIVVTILGASTRVRLQDLTIVHGNDAGIQNAGGTMELIRAAVRDNTGDGILNNVGTMTLTRSTVCSNSSQFSGGIGNMASMTLNDSTVCNNGSQANGGGIFNEGPMTLHDSTVRHNGGINGGGIFNFSAGTLTLDRSRVRDNTTANNGGGIYNQGTTKLKDSAVERNIATVDGGGIYNTGTVTLQRSKVRDNRPDNCAPAGSVPGCTG